MSRRFALVLTTIHVPRLLDDYLADFRAHGRDAEILVIGDEQTPPEAASYLRQAGVEYFDLPRQLEWLRRFPQLGRLLPVRSIQRRNLGYLLAYERGADVIISIDDDNFLCRPDYLGGHARVGERLELPAMEPNPWVNVCSLLETAPPRRFYHRGFPISQRWRDPPLRWTARQGRVAVNVGLWLGDPDVDTITRLEEPFVVVAHRGPAHAALGRGAWSPFNSQNTAFLRELLPFAYLVVAGRSLRGFRGDLVNFRYDDIWMSYLARRAIDHMDDLIAFGEPIVEQRRNPHSLLQDLDRELIPMTLTEPLIEMLAELPLSAKNYPELQAETVDGLRAAVGRHPRLDARERQFFAEVIDGMQIWQDVCRTLG